MRLKIFAIILFLLISAHAKSKLFMAPSLYYSFFGNHDGTFAFGRFIQRGTAGIKGLVVSQDILYL